MLFPRSLSRLALHAPLPLMRRWALWVLIICIGLIIAPKSSFSQKSELAETAFLVNYGRYANKGEGDDDFLHVIFIRIPESLKHSLVVQIFDPDCGDDFDASFSGSWNTTTRFRLFGGAGAFSPPELNLPTPPKAVREAGVLLADQEFGRNPDLNRTWYPLAEIAPEAGELVDQYRYFKLLVEGMKGIDGNRFQVAVTRARTHQAASAAYPLSGLSIIPQAALFTYAATVNLPRHGVFEELRFWIPAQTRSVTVHNFDLAGAGVSLDTAFRSKLPIPSSGQNEWKKGTVNLHPWETNGYGAIRYSGGREMPNDATFYISTDKGKYLPIFLPIHIRQQDNQPPLIQYRADFIRNCYSVRFDAGGTIDPEGDALVFQWQFGDGNFGTGMQVEHEYAAPGKYAVALIVTDDSGRVFNSARQEFPLKINHPPIADAGSDQITAPAERIKFDASGSYDPDGRIIQYQWDFGDGGQSVGKIAQHRYQAPGRYVVSLEITDDSGSLCATSRDQSAVWVNSAPTVDIGGDKIAAIDEEIIFDGVFSDVDGSIVDCVWELGDGVNKRGLSVTHRYAKPGRYAVKVTVIDDAGAANSSVTKSLNVFVNDPPQADAGPDQRVSVGETVVLDGSKSHDRDGKLIAFHWDFGDGTKAQSDCRSQAGVSEKTAFNNCAVVSHRYLQPGQYLVRLTVTDDSGASSAMREDTTLIIVNDPPVAMAGPDIRANTGEVRLDGSGSIDRDGKIIKYLWEFGDGEKSSLPSPTHVYANPGTYLVRLSVWDDSHTSSNLATDELTVIINEAPIADAGPDQKSVPGQTLTFDGSGSVDPDGQIVSWKWDLGDGAAGDGARIRHAYQSPGKYTVQLIVVDDAGLRAFDSALVIINAAPQALAGSDQRIAPGETAKLDGTRSYDPDGKIASWNWTIRQDSETIIASFDAPTASYRFMTPGVYRAMLTVADDSRMENSTAQNAIVISVNHSPVANAGQDILTAEHSLIFSGEASADADGDPLEFSWDFGDGSPPGKGIRVMHRYDKEGLYPVVLTVDDGTRLGNSRASASIMVRINTPPTAQAGADIEVCAGKTVIFDGGQSRDPDGGLLSYHWDFGDGQESHIVNPVKIYKTGGAYHVTLKVRDDSGLSRGNTDIDRMVVKVVESPVADAGPDQNVCAGSPVYFDGTRSTDVDGVVNSYLWDFGDGLTGGGPNPVHIYDKPGIYRVILFITGDKISHCPNNDSDEMLVTVSAAPLIQAVFAETAAPGTPVKFLAQAAADPLQAAALQWRWDFGDGAQAEAQEVEHVYRDPGHYLVALTATNTISAECNRSSLTRRIRINAAPAAEIDLSGAIVDPENGAGKQWLIEARQPVLFDGSASTDSDGAIIRYYWDFGDGASAEGVAPYHRYAAPGVYQVKLSVFDEAEVENSRTEAEVSVRVNGAPLPEITVAGGQMAAHGSAANTAEPIRACVDQELIFDASRSLDPEGSELTLTWRFSDETAEQAAPIIRRRFDRPGYYTATLCADDGEGLSNSVACTSVAMLIHRSPEIRIIPKPERQSPHEPLTFGVWQAPGVESENLNFHWDFGDGKTGAGLAVQHTYHSAGNYQVSLTVSDRRQTGCRDFQDVIPVQVNATPVAHIRGDAAGFCGGANDFFYFDASDSTDADQDPLTYRWDFGDGNTASSRQVRHQYAAPGKYAVVLRVDDGLGLKSSSGKDTLTVEVRRRPR